MNDRSEHRRGHRSISVQLKALEPRVLEAGVPLRPYFRLLQRQLGQTAEPQRALTNLQRFLEQGFSIGWLRDFHLHPPLQQLALDIFAQSQFLADIIVRDPELFRWLISGDTLDEVRMAEEVRSEALHVAGMFSRSEKKLDALKRFQRRELLRIGAREILRRAPVDDITNELSALADAIIGAVLAVALEEVRRRSGADFSSTLAVVALGKLGGTELNFSSDVDLLFVYDKEGELPDLRERIGSFQDFYARVCELLVRHLTTFTGEGHLYRVDMRLRPDGGAGPLVMSRHGYLLYYESRGEVWERQMLVKARIVAGDEATGTKFLADIAPFIYRKTTIQSPLGEIASMKNRIEQTLRTKENVKLGAGGIRDIEFVVQALQLLRGGSDPTVRAQGTIPALGMLRQAAMISQTEEKSMSDAYRFLRTVEHRLQLFHGTQVHALPADQAEYRLLAKRLGFRSSDSFRKMLSQHQRRVRRVFDSVFSVGGKGRRAPRDDSRTVETLGRQALGAGRRTPILRKEFLAAWHEIVGMLGLHEDSSIVRHLSSEVRRLRAPAWTIQNFRLLVNSDPIRRSLSQAVRNPDMLSLLLLVSARSRRLSYMLSVEPLLFESFLGQPHQFLWENPVVEFMLDHDPLRYRQYNEFRIALRFLTAAIDVQQMTRELSDLADAILTRHFALTVQGVATDGGELPFCVLGLGKVGGREITFGADIDCVFLFKDRGGQGSDRWQETLARKFMENLGSKGVYQIDARLRPEGRSAPLATEIDYFRRYLAERASVWERQSLIKARLLSGQADIGKEAMRMIENYVYETPLPKGWTDEIQTMRQRVERERGDAVGDGGSLKTGKGGLIDAEFAIQALQLRFASRYPDLRVTGSFDAMPLLAKHRETRFAGTKASIRALEHLRTIETFVRLNSETPHFQLPRRKEEFEAVSAGAGASTSRAFAQALRRSQTRVRGLFRTSMIACRTNE